MNTTQLEAFTAVADTLSFARAAERLHVTQPAVTHQIRTLEAELGVTLFQRTTRRVRLTNEGQLFLADAESIIAAMRRASARFRLAENVESTRLAVGCRSYAHMIFLADVIRDLAATHPGLMPDLLVVPHEHMHQLLEDGEVDVVLDFEGTGRRAESFEKLCDIEVACFCPSGSVLAQRERIWSQDLDDVPLALPRPEHLPQSIRSDFMHIVANRKRARFYPCDSVEAALMLVAAGLATTVLPILSIPPEFAKQAIPYGGAEPIAFGAYTLGSDQNELMRAFIDGAKQALAR